MSAETAHVPTLQTGGHCCSPHRGASSGAVAVPDVPAAFPTGSAPGRTDLLSLAGGTFWLGSDEDRYPEDGEGPSRPAHVDGFSIAAHTVSNDDFARFVAATG